jgi:hypothetical protein
MLINGKVLESREICRKYPLGSVQDFVIFQNKKKMVYWDIKDRRGVEKCAILIAFRLHDIYFFDLFFVFGGYFAVFIFDMVFSLNHEIQLK